MFKFIEKVLFPDSKSKDTVKNSAGSKNPKPTAAEIKTIDASVEKKPSNKVNSKLEVKESPAVASAKDAAKNVASSKLSIADFDLLKVI